MNLLLIVLGSILAMVCAHRYGADPQACDTMKPGHGTTRRQTRATPYIVETHQPGYVPCRTLPLANQFPNCGVMVRIRTRRGGNFKGFLLQARSKMPDGSVMYVGDFRYANGQMIPSRAGNVNQLGRMQNQFNNRGGVSLGQVGGSMALGQVGGTGGAMALGQVGGPGGAMALGQVGGPGGAMALGQVSGSGGAMALGLTGDQLQNRTKRQVGGGFGNQFGNQQFGNQFGNQFNRFGNQGQFQRQTTNVVVQKLSCSKGFGVTHTENNLKNYVQLIWYPPVGFNRPIQFVATVVQDFNTYWMGHRSAVMRARPRLTMTRTAGQTGGRWINRYNSAPKTTFSLVLLATSICSILFYLL